MRAVTSAQNCASPADAARPRQRHVLPGPGFRLVVEAEAVDMDGDRSLAARRPQAHVDRKERALPGRRRQRGDQALRQPGEPGGRRERADAIRFDHPLVVIVEDDEVEVGGRGHLPSAELAKAQHGNAPAGRHAVHARELRPRRGQAAPRPRPPPGPRSPPRPAGAAGRRRSGERRSRTSARGQRFGPDRGGPHSHRRCRAPRAGGPPSPGRQGSRWSAPGARPGHAGASRGAPRAAGRPRESRRAHRGDGCCFAGSTEAGSPRACGPAAHRRRRAPRPAGPCWRRHRAKPACSSVRSSRARADRMAG